MTIGQLVDKCKESVSTRTDEDRFRLLVEANILDKDGNYDARFFSKKTVEQSKLNKIKRI